MHARVMLSFNREKQNIYSIAALIYKNCGFNHPRNREGQCRGFRIRRWAVRMLVSVLWLD